jgi:SAM-dependent methyltransferase
MTLSHVLSFHLIDLAAKLMLRAALMAGTPFVRHPMSTMETTQISSECCICRARGPKTFAFMNSHYVFDVDKARQLVQDGREPLELDPDDVGYSLEQCRIHKDHLLHVDVKHPGIIAHVWHPNPDGELIHGHRMIDGHHRAARSLELGLPFFVYLLTEEESRAVLNRVPETAAEPIPGATAEPKERNRLAWNALVAKKHRFTRPPSDESAARQRVSRWLTGIIKDKRMLLLGAGGGSQSVMYARNGALVTVVDLSDEMLELDRQQAARRSLDIKVIQASMDDLSMLEPASFDIVDQPVSTCYVPDVVAVYRQVARVLVPGGLYVSQHKQPTSLQCSIKPGPDGYVLTEPYYRSGPLPPSTGSRIREEGTIEFLHRWEDLIGGLCRCGFVIEDLREPNRGAAGAPRGSYEHRSLYVAPYVRIKARRIAETSSGEASPVLL